MADKRLRGLERKWFESGSPDDEAAYVVASVRAGRICVRDLSVAARLRSVGADDEDLLWLSHSSDEGATAVLTALRQQREQARQRRIQQSEGADRTFSIRLSDYFEPISDEDLPEGLTETGAKWRRMAQARDYDGLVAWRVREGFTLKQHAPNAGPCYERFEYLQDWDFEDEPTQDSLVFWIPRLVPNSRNKNVNEQHEVLNRLRTEYDLPEHHLSSFGSVALLAGLILRHFELTDERVPLNRLWARTETVLSRGVRLSLGRFLEYGLFCDYWGRDVGSYGDLGCFAWGVELGI